MMRDETLHLSDLIDQMEEEARDALGGTIECAPEDQVRVLCFLRMCLGTMVDFVQISDCDYVQTVAQNILIAAKEPFDPWDEETHEGTTEGAV